jgi:hypothetical protein
MTKTFERFLRSFTDDELTAFAQDRGRARPPYWKLLRLALLVEADRRQLRFDGATAELIGETTPRPKTRTGTA